MKDKKAKNGYRKLECNGGRPDGGGRPRSRELTHRKKGWGGRREESRGLLGALSRSAQRQQTKKS